WPDAHMDRALQFALSDPAVPEAVKHGAGWPHGMRAEFDRDRLAAAADHRRALVDGCRRIRAELDAFAPDVVVIWGDDQYELFREDVVPAFCVVAAPEMSFRPWQSVTGSLVENVWDEPISREFRVEGHEQFGRHLAASLLQ